MGYSSDDPGALVSVFRETLRREGLPAALRFLNGRTRHRFTGLYRFDAPWLRNVCLVDRENPHLVLGGDTPLNETYCGVVRETGHRFATDDASADTRLVLHPQHTQLLAYCGVPVCGPDGECIGTLCHFDPRPRLAPVQELPLLEQAAALLAPFVAAAASPAHAAVSSSRSASTRTRSDRESTGTQQRARHAQPERPELS